MRRHTRALSAFVVVVVSSDVRPWPLRTFARRPVIYFILRTLRMLREENVGITSCLDEVGRIGELYIYTYIKPSSGKRRHIGYLARRMWNRYGSSLCARNSFLSNKLRVFSGVERFSPDRRGSRRASRSTSTTRRKGRIVPSPPAHRVCKYSTCVVRYKATKHVNLPFLFTFFQYYLSPFHIHTNV